ncbi:hypothetical protein GXB81_21020 [Paraburkholderia sp. Ac-20336]|uniref:hypothetical protein n=1 Tax=Burkholderiaceae TaxID=119060 RepID=UPI00141EEDE9|nr:MULTISPECIES: hypothetical protein [Burkholderiaceae]MBN3805514.1 hypothetical protein [Paraburkholderia sp. Ac-20336]NIF55579.1 hypothetical protein [Burkholderia sp. Ax-1724]
MDIGELLDAAKRKKRTLGTVAKEMGLPNQTRLSEWRSGRFKPTATQIAQLAEIAELPIFKTVAEVEASLEVGDAAQVWQRALKTLNGALKIQE